MDFQAIRSLVIEDLEQTNTLIHTHLDSHVAVIKEIGHYIVDAGGKRSRAILALLSSRVCGLPQPKAALFSAIIELLHAATLLHDDVVDGSELRRGKPSANMIYDNSASVLAGDFLYSRTFEMMVELNNMDLLKRLAIATNTLAEGEMLQLQNCHKCDITEADYLKVIDCKTATLFTVAAEIPALLNSAPEPIQQALENYGHSLGIAFQLVDDVIDYTSNEATMGKSQGDDLAEGKITLPLIYAKANGTTEDRKVIDEAILHGDATALPKILEIIQRTDSTNQVLNKAQFFVNQAKSALAILPESRYTTALAHFADLAVSRSA